MRGRSRRRITGKVTFKARNGGADEDALQLELDDNRQFSLNKTNTMALINLYGRSTANWVGKTITLYVDPNVMFSGRLVGGVRVRIQDVTLHEQNAADIAEAMPDSPVL